MDDHKHIVQASLINEEGKRLESHRFACTQESILAFARQRLQPEDQIALEATTNTWAVVALLRPFVARIVVANPLRTRAIAEASDPSRATGSPTSGSAGRVFPALESQKEHNIAVVATARKLVVIAHLMLKNREPYRYAVPATTRDKQAALRDTATGLRRRKSGPLRESMQANAKFRGGQNSRQYVWVSVGR